MDAGPSSSACPVIACCSTPEAITTGRPLQAKAAARPGPPRTRTRVSSRMERSSGAMSSYRRNWAHRRRRARAAISPRPVSGGSHRPAGDGRFHGEQRAGTCALAARQGRRAPGTLPQRSHRRESERGPRPRILGCLRNARRPPVQGPSPDTLRIGGAYPRVVAGSLGPGAQEGCHTADRCGSSSGAGGLATRRWSDWPREWDVRCGVRPVSRRRSRPLRAGRRSTGRRALLRCRSSARWRSATPGTASA
jgi:hypothetical protein